MKTLYWSIFLGMCALMLLLPPTLFRLEKRLVSAEKATQAKASSTNHITYALPEDILDKSKYLQIDTPVPTGGGAWTWTKTNWVRNYWYDTNEEHELVLPQGSFIHYKSAVICRITNDADWALLSLHFTNEMPDSKRMTFIWYEPKTP